jgi:integrase/recombinase XerD
VKRDRRHERAKKLEDLVPTEPGTIGYYVRQYLEHLEIRNYSPHSTRSRSTHLRYFAVWCDERGLAKPEEITVAVLERYQRALYYQRKENGRALTFRSQNDRLGSVKRFFRWMAKMRHLEMSPAEMLELPRIERRLPKTILTIEEAEKVLSQPDVTTPLGIRDRAVLELLYSTGMRRQELANLALYDADIEGRTILVRQGKGKKDRMIPIGERAAAWLAKYLEEVRPSLALEPDDGTLFLTRLREPFSGERLSDMVREYVDEAAIGKRGACHMFRHTMATLMLEGGADIRFIQAMLGHADISTTQIYTRVAIRKLKEVHEMTHPGAKLERRERSGSDDDESEPTREELLSSLAAEAAEEGE